MNELLLAGSVLFIFGAVLVAWYFFGKAGLYVMTAVVTILANIEVLILVDAFGIEQTLGNILFAATFLITDILSENEGKQAARKSFLIGVFGTIFFVLLSTSWIFYIPSTNDWARPSIETIFTATPRVVIASMSVYAISQLLDVWLYHSWWAFTTKKFGASEKFLWLRNNGSTLISQLVNTVLFNVLAFAGMPGYTVSLLVKIIVAGYIIYVVTSLLDTPAAYIARYIHKKRVQKNLEDTALAKV
ncbi:MAG: queuosine precursor transporter [Eggerthellaceae bacterium]|nr:queuosine precursor transporter [Eggerthellaceae bacterium]